MWESISTLFDGLGILPMIIFTVGIIFCVIEVFVPGFGIFGILGSIFISIGVVVRFVLDFDVQHLIFMIMFAISFVVVAFLIMLHSVKHGLLGKSPFVEHNTAISVNYSKDNKELLKILGKEAFTDTKFLPAGKFSLEGVSYEALSYGEYIDKGVKIQVVEISGDTIYVRKSKE